MTRKLKTIMLSTLFVIGAAEFTQTMDYFKKADPVEGSKNKSENKATNSENFDRNVKDQQSKKDTTKKSNKNSSTPTNSSPERTSSNNNGDGFNLADSTTSTTHALNERGEKINNLNDTSSNMKNSANDFAKMAKQLSEQSKGVKKPSDTKSMIDKMDPNGKLTPEQQDQAMKESQSWISPYDGSKFQEWVDSVMNLIAGKGYKTTAQIETDKQTQKDAEIKIQEIKISDLQNKSDTLQKEIDAQNKIIQDNQPSLFDVYDTTKQNKSTNLTTAQKELINLQKEQKTSQFKLSDAKNDLNTMKMTPEELAKNLKDNSAQSKAKNEQNSQAQGRQDQGSWFIGSAQQSGKAN